MSPGPSKHDPITELALDESAEELYELAPCGYLTTDLDGRIVKVNKTLTDWLGCEPEELIAKKRFVDLLTVGGKIFYETHFNLLLRVQTVVEEIALDLAAKDGRVLPMLINARQKRDPAGEPVLNYFTLFNSSERRLYERQLLAARDLLQVTLSSIGDGVIATDAVGNITFMNPVAEKLSGCNNDAAIGKPIEEILALRNESSGSVAENPVTHALRDGVIVGLSNHTVLLARDGRIIPIDDSASPIRDANGGVIGGILVFRDISNQRNAEKALIAAHEQLELRAEELHRSNEELSRFAHVASHDLRSPLNTIMQYAELLERRHGAHLGKDKELLDYLTGAVKRMEALIADLLAFAGVSASVPLPKIVDANEQLKVAIENLTSKIEESGAVVSADALPAVQAGETSLVQIFQNLIGNAIHYRGDETPRIHISATEQGDQWLFSCEDNGIGIAPEYHAQIFEPFKRLHGADVPGSGIGLAVCRRIVERYGGRIRVESAEGEGSCFLFTLPKGN